MSLIQDFKQYPETRASWYFKSGLIEFLAGNTHRALSLFNFAIKLNPNYSDCYFCKGFVLAGLNRKEESLECWNYLLQENKNLSFINIIKAKILWNLDKIASEEAYDEFIQNIPERYFVNVLKLDHIIENDNDFIVLKGSNEMIGLNPKFSWAYLTKCSDVRDPNELLKYCNKATESDEHCYLAYILIATQFLEKGNFEEFLENINISIKINPYNAITFLIKAFALFNSERTEEAYECFNEVYSLNPKSFDDLHNDIGKELLKRGEWEKANKFYDIAIRIKPDNKEYQDNKNEALRKLEETKNH